MIIGLHQAVEDGCLPFAHLPLQLLHDGRLAFDKVVLLGGIVPQIKQLQFILAADEELVAVSLTGEGL